MIRILTINTYFIYFFLNGNKLKIYQEKHQENYLKKKEGLLN